MASNNGKERHFLSREAILEADDLPVEELEVPEWGCWVRIKAMDALKMQRLANALVGLDDEHMHVLMVAASLVDENGEPLFSLDDVDELKKKRGEAIRRISEAAMKLNRSGPQAVEAFQENFPETQAEGSPSA